jgi:hypothetical protein
LTRSGHLADMAKPALLTRKSNSYLTELNSGTKRRI